MRSLELWRRRWWRCPTWAAGPFFTEWRCLHQRGHEGDHIYEPDVWNMHRHTLKGNVEIAGDTGDAHP